MARTFPTARSTKTARPKISQKSKTTKNNTTLWFQELARKNIEKGRFQREIIQDVNEKPLDNL